MKLLIDDTCHDTHISLKAEKILGVLITFTP